MTYDILLIFLNLACRNQSYLKESYTPPQSSLPVRIIERDKKRKEKEKEKKKGREEDGAFL